MTDEELAEEYADRTRIVDENTRVGDDCISLVQDYEGNIIDIHERIKQAFLAGLKAEWHDLRKDPNDLPDEGSYLVVWQNLRGYRETMIMEYEEDNDDETLHWIDGDGDNWDDNVIAWCEIPEFK